MTYILYNFYFDFFIIVIGHCIIFSLYLYIIQYLIDIKLYILVSLECDSFNNMVKPTPHIMFIKLFVPLILIVLNKIKKF